jgi:hypothetical protein
MLSCCRQEQSFVDLFRERSSKNRIFIMVANAAPIIPETNDPAALSFRPLRMIPAFITGSVPASGLWCGRPITPDRHPNARERQVEAHDHRPGGRPRDGRGAAAFWWFAYPPASSPQPGMRQDMCKWLILLNVMHLRFIDFHLFKRYFIHGELGFAPTAKNALTALLRN